MKTFIYICVCLLSILSTLNIQAKTYEGRVYTCDENGAGTDHNTYLRLKGIKDGTLMTSNKIELTDAVENHSKSGADPLEQNDKDYWKMSGVTDVGWIYELTVETTDDTNGYCMDRIWLTDPKIKEVDFQTYIRGKWGSEGKGWFKHGTEYKLRLRDPITAKKLAHQSVQIVDVTFQHNIGSEKDKTVTLERRKFAKNSYSVKEQTEWSIDNTTKFEYSDTLMVKDLFNTSKKFSTEFKSEFKNAIESSSSFEEVTEEILKEEFTHKLPADSWYIVYAIQYYRAIPTVVTVEGIGERTFWGASNTSNGDEGFLTLNKHCTSKVLKHEWETVLSGAKNDSQKEQLIELYKRFPNCFDF